MKLNEFLVKAKKNTYAGNGKEIILPDGGKELIYEKDVFKYRDRYYGFNPFSGQELVWENNKLVWSMNYRGEIFYKLLEDKITEKEVYDFLKEALRNVYEDAPYRGPYKFEKNNLRYFCNFEGDINNFKGKEFITHLERPLRIYYLDFHGGSLKQKQKNARN